MDESNKSEQMEENKPSSHIRLRKFTLVMLIFFTVFATAGVTTFALAFGNEKAVEVGAPDRREFEKLYQAYDQLTSSYFKELDQQVLIDGAINGMLDSMKDPYSDYMTQDEAKEFRSTLSSSFEGIGAEIQERDGSILVVSPIKGAPAEKAGLLPNDEILEVNGESVQGLTVNEAVMKIRGEKGTEVSLTIRRAGSSEPITIDIVRDEIPIDTVYLEMKNENVAHIQITNFSENTYEEFVEKLNEARSQGMKSLVLDMRQNPGGLLDQAIYIASLFIEEGEGVVSVDYRAGEDEEINARGGEKVDVPTTVLINEGSASASEIVAAALQESAGIKVIGTKSFGKGTVQSPVDFNDGSNMKFTTARWLTPNGNWINEKGIEPDVQVELPEYASLPFLNQEEEYKLNVISEQVEVAEKMLTALGYTIETVDRTFTEETEVAVKQFQLDNELEQTGVLTGDTTFTLLNKLREDLQKNDPQLKAAMKELGVEDVSSSEETETE